MRKVGFSILPQRWYIELFIVGSYLTMFLPIQGVISLYYNGSTTTHREFESLDEAYEAVLNGQNSYDSFRMVLSRGTWTWGWHVVDNDTVPIHESISGLIKPLIIESSYSGGQPTEEDIAQTIIDGQSLRSPIKIESGNNDVSVNITINGITLQNGSGLRNGFSSIPIRYLYGDPNYHQDLVPLSYPGGAIFISQYEDQAGNQNPQQSLNCVISNCRIVNNQASDGAGIFAYKIGSLIVENCSILNNANILPLDPDITTSFGQALCIFGSEFKMINSTVSQNGTPTYPYDSACGIIRIDNYDERRTYEYQIVNSIVDKNYSFRESVSMLCHSNDVCIIKNSNIVDNIVSTDPGLHLDGQRFVPNITNCIIYNNTTTSPDAITDQFFFHDLAETDSTSYNLIHHMSPNFDNNGTNFDADPLFVDPDNGDYSLRWSTTEKSPCINAGYHGENGELTDPDGTPPDIGYVYYPHAKHRYVFNRSPSAERILWLSFPVLDDRSNTDDTYWNELGYMFSDHMQGPPAYSSQLQQIQWSYDSEMASFVFVSPDWINEHHPATQPKGYKVQFNTLGTISDIVVIGFKVDAATTPIAWLAQIEENGQSRPFENWIGYFATSTKRAGDAFSRFLPNSLTTRYLDYIYGIKTQYWGTSRQSATPGSPWIIDPNSYTLYEGEMVALVLLPDAPDEMYWDTSSAPVKPREIPRSTAFEYVELLDYTPVYIEFDPQNVPDEIGLFVDGDCKGAAVVDSTIISVCLYNEASKAGGDLELVFYYEGKGKSVSEGWTVYNPKSLVFEESGLRADQIGDYAYISFNREEGDSPTPLVTSLRQNYPNPFNPSTTISFVLGTESEANLDIFNARGQLIRSFRYDWLARGLHSLDWDGKDNTGRVVSSGLYFYRLRTPEKSLVNKMLLVK